MAGLDIRILLEYNPCCSAPLKKGGLAVLGLLTSGSIYEFRFNVRFGKVLKWCG